MNRKKKTNAGVKRFDNEALYKKDKETYIKCWRNDQSGVRNHNISRDQPNAAVKETETDESLKEKSKKDENGVGKLEDIEAYLTPGTRNTKEHERKQQERQAASSFQPGCTKLYLLE